MTTDAPGVFISYRRKVSSHIAGRLYDRLVERLGEARVFMDVDYCQRRRLARRDT
jgi:hypothetical protein